MTRVVANGKHLDLGGERFVVRGVTYGSFDRRPDGYAFPESHVIRADLTQMAGIGLNTVRIYERPAPELLDVAAELGMRVIVGLDFHDWRMEPEPSRASDRRVRAAGLSAVQETMEICAGRDEVLAVCVGNEVPGDLVRVHGIGRVEDILSELVDAVHCADPDVLVSYTNYPTTEYLQVSGIDLHTFNVFLERPADFTRYLRHLQVVSGRKPLLITELGLASHLHGAQEQARLLDEQLRIIDTSGCAGATVFSWTDEWSVGGEAVEGWGFGITDAARNPKPAIEPVRQWAARTLKDLRDTWPRVTVVVCAYNEQRTIVECLRSLERCDYPDLEVIVCDDGSTDSTRALCEGFPFRVLDLPHGGLSRARNAGIEAASGEIVAFLDADAACHPQWPWFLALAFDDDTVGGAGGPNLPFPGADLVERAVALSPGSPTEVLLADDRAEHIAGCNMAFRRDDVMRVGAFDPTYTSAGDDVDVCWKLMDAGKAIAFSPAAQVVHHRRAAIRGYLRQQRGYGRAEKLLSGAHPHRFNSMGQAQWSGFIYGGVGLLPRLLRPTVYHGWQGHSPFQNISGRRAETTSTWFTALVPFGLPIAAAGLALAVVEPRFLGLPASVLGIYLFYLLAIAVSTPVERSEPHPLRLRATVSLLHLLQPFVRTWGRLQGKAAGTSQSGATWSGQRSTWLSSLRRELRSRGLSVRAGSPTAAWDLECRSSMFVRCRITTGVAWRWVPQWSTRFSLSWRWAGAAVVLIFGLMLWSRPVAAVAAVVVVVFTVLQLRALRRAVRQSIVATSGGPPR